MKITEMCRILRLSYVRDNFEMLASDAQRCGQSPCDFLEILLRGECERRIENSISRRLSEAKFPFKKYLTDFKRDKYPQEFGRKFDVLESLKFIENKENIILIGTSGAGKTHYAIALGISACMQGMSVLFVSAPDIVAEVKEAATNLKYTALKRKFASYDLVIMDELGYVSFDKSGGELLFNLLSSRYTKGSVIITTNLDFSKWTDIFGDPALTGALVDRLAHKAHVLDISREKGGRLEETIAWLEECKN